MELLTEVKAWVLGLIIGPVLGLLLWYFRRSQTQIDKKLEALDASLDEVREVLAAKVDRPEMTQIWDRLRLQDQDIKNLGASFSRELREQIDGLRREQSEHQRQTNDRLDRALTLLANISRGRE